MATKLKGKAAKAASDVAPADQLKNITKQLLSTVASRAANSVTDKVSSTAQRLTDYAENGGSGGLKAALTGAEKLAEGKSPMRAALSAGMSQVKDKIKGAFGGGGGKNKIKVTNIVESIDVGVPVDVAYAQWTRFTEFPTYMKKVENVDQAEDEVLEWKAQVFWSHRTWEAEILEQVPNSHIVWQSKGEKGFVNGAVTFHELAPRLTRVLLVLEYHPKGLFEHTGNIWRAQGRRARLELKHFGRKVMTDTILHPEEIEGWQGEIRDGEVVDDGSSRPDGATDKSTKDARNAKHRRDEDEADESEEPDDTYDIDDIDEADEVDESDQDVDEDEVASDNGDEPARPRRRGAARGRRTRSGSTRTRAGGRT